MMTKLVLSVSMIGLVSACGSDMGGGGGPANGAGGVQGTAGVGQHPQDTPPYAGNAGIAGGGSNGGGAAGAGADPTEAPVGFETPFVAAAPGSKSVSNGIAEPDNDSYALDQKSFERVRDESTGIGPVFNANSCAECHANPVVGGNSQFTEVRAGHLDAMGAFVNPTVTINGGATTITGRSIINDRATTVAAQEYVPATETIVALRATLNTLGDGFVEAVADETLLEIAKNQADSDTGVHGQAVKVQVLEAPAGVTRVGRFGWKDQQPTLLSFAGDAYLNEMGVTNRLRPKDVTAVGDVATDPEDVPDDIGLADIDHFAQFIRGTKAPPRDETLAKTADAVAGEALFASVGCNTCHVESLTTVPAGTVIAGVYTVPEAIGNKIFHPFGDFLLHDIGTGDGILQTASAPDSAKKLRTSPLWGLRTRPRFMHDLVSLTLMDAITRHAGEAQFATTKFTALSDTEKSQLFAFLSSL